MEPSVFTGFVLSILLGGLIGAERELPWSGTKPGGATGFGGIRTFASISLLGAIGVWIDSLFGGHVWVLFGAVTSALFILASYMYSSFRKDRMGTTSEYATLITYFIGVVSMYGNYSSAVILAIFLLLLLSAKEYFAKLKARFSREELGDTLKFAVIALVILPLLPDTKYSLLDIVNWFHQGGITWTHPVLQAHFFNPYGIWFFVVIMAGVEYAGFILSKLIGTKGGIIASGLIGGLISSTATTVAMTKKSKEHPEHKNSYVVATLLSSCIMFLRVIVVAAYLYVPILHSIGVPALFMFIGLAGATLYFYLKTRNETVLVQVDEKKREYESPFQLLPALNFAALIVFIKFVSQVGVIYKAIVPIEVSSYFLGLISGLADVDGVNYIYSTAAKTGDISTFIAASTILIAVMSNNTVKASIAYRFGEKEFGKKVITAFGISIAIGVLVILSMSISIF